MIKNLYQKGYRKRVGKNSNVNPIGGESRHQYVGFPCYLERGKMSSINNDRSYIHIQADRSFWNKIDMKDQNNANE